MDLTKPARLQVDADQIPDDDKPPQTGHTFNIWYLQWAGGDPTSRGQVKLKFRLNVVRDSGYTRAKDGRSAICLFYARGCCYRGENCLYLHRPAKPQDIRMHTQDCFGRDKTADYRDDMSGVGLLSRVNKTLFVGGISPNEKIHEQLSKLFLEYGAIDKIKVLPAKKCAFVSFRLEAEAQFVKEAMDCQSLGENDILSVKWANEDMNPEAQKLAQQAMESMALETVKRLLGDVEFPDLQDKKRPKKDIKRVKSDRKVLQELTSKKEESSIEEQDDVGEIETEFGSHNNPIIDDSRLLALKTAVKRYLETKEEKTKSAVDSLNQKQGTGIENLLSGYSSN